MKRKKKNDSEDAPVAEATDETATAEANDASGTEAGGPESLEDALKQRDEYLELYKRAQADYKNLRRRAQSDLEAGLRRQMQPLLDSLLLVLDHLDMALMAPTPNEETKNFAIGVEMTRNQLVAALGQEEVSEISTKGAFDPEKHQAVSTVETDEVAPGEIVATIRKGYTWGDLVLRHAHVSVAAEQAEASEETESAE